MQPYNIRKSKSEIVKCDMHYQASLIAGFRTVNAAMETSLKLAITFKFPSSNHPSCEILRILGRVSGEVCIDSLPSDEIIHLVINGLGLNFIS